MIGVLISILHERLGKIEGLAAINSDVHMGMGISMAVDFSKAFGIGAGIGSSIDSQQENTDLLENVVAVLTVFSSMKHFEATPLQMVLEGVVPLLLRCCITMHLMLSQETHNDSISMDHHLQFIKQSEPNLQLHFQQGAFVGGSNVAGKRNNSRPVSLNKSLVRQHIRLLGSASEALANICSSSNCRNCLLQQHSNDNHILKQNDNNFIEKADPDNRHLAAPSLRGVWAGSGLVLVQVEQYEGLGGGSTGPKNDNNESSVVESDNAGIDESGMSVFLCSLRMIFGRVSGQVSFNATQKLPTLVTRTLASEDRTESKDESQTPLTASAVSTEEDISHEYDVEQFASTRIHMESRAYEAILVNVTQCISGFSVHLEEHIHLRQQSDSSRIGNLYAPATGPTTSAAANLATPLAQVAVAPLLLDSGVLPHLLQLCNDARSPGYLESVFTNGPQNELAQLNGAHHELHENRRLLALVHCTTALRHMSCNEMVLVSMLKGYYVGSGDDYGLRAEQDEEAGEQHRQHVTAPCIRLSMKVGEYFVEAFCTHTENIHRKSMNAQTIDMDSKSQRHDGLTSNSPYHDHPINATTPLLLPAATIMHNCAQIMVRIFVYRISST